MSPARAWTDEELFSQFPAMRELFGPRREDAWAAMFEARPDAVHAILADVIKQAYAVPGRVGQRPMPKEEDVEDLNVILHGETNDLPLGEVLPKLMRCSERKFCQRVNMSRRTFQRLLQGEYEPDLSQLRRIAQAVNRPPSYFVEYRRKMLAAAFADLLANEPIIADSLFRSFVVARDQSRKPRTERRPLPKGVRSMAEAVGAIHRIAEQFELDVAVRPLEPRATESR